MSVRSLVLVRLGVACAFVLVAGLAAWAAASQPYTSPAGGYRVVFPAGTRPMELPKKEQTPFGELQTMTCMVMNKKAAFYAGYCEYPPGTVDKVEDPLPLLEAAAEAMAKNMEGSVQGKAPFSLKGYKGLSTSFTGRFGPSPMVGQSNLILVRSRLYMIYALAPTGEHLLGQETRAFFSSFDLL